MKFYLKLFMIIFVMTTTGCGFDDAENSSSESADGAKSDPNENNDKNDQRAKQKEVPFDREKLIKNYADNIIVPAYNEFQTESELFVKASSDYLKALRESSSDIKEKKQALKNAWKSVMLKWQGLELLQVGPAGAMNKIMGGQDIRDEIYSWPSTNTCIIDQILDNGDYSNVSFFDSNKVNVYGLDSAEYLIFSESPENTCNSDLALNKNGTWKARSAEELAKIRAEYISVITKQVKREADKLSSLWQSNDDSFYKKFVEFDSSDVYADGQSVINDIFAAMFYFEKKVKDFKLADPIGIGLGCRKDFCPELRESVYSNHSKENMLANMLMFEKIFLGEQAGLDDGYGFYELLMARKAYDLADKMKVDIANLISELKSLKASFKDTLKNDLESAKAVYEKIKLVTNSFKTQFVTTLDLRVPKEGAADND